MRWSRMSIQAKAASAPPRSAPSCSARQQPLYGRRCADLIISLKGEQAKRAHLTDQPWAVRCGRPGIVSITIADALCQSERATRPGGLAQQQNHNDRQMEHIRDDRADERGRVISEPVV